MTVTFGLSSALVVGQALKVGLLARFVQSLWQRCAVGLLVKRHRYMGAAPTWPISSANARPDAGKQKATRLYSPRRNRGGI